MTCVRIKGANAKPNGSLVASNDSWNIYNDPSWTVCACLPYADSPEATCAVLQAIADNLEARGSSCAIRDDDQDSCNDCLWLNCTNAFPTGFGPTHVIFHTRILPCYSYNDTADIDIHATNTSLFSVMGAAPLATFFADRTEAMTLRVVLAGFSTNYTVYFTLEQLGHGIMFGVRCLSLLCSVMHHYTS